MKKSCEALTYKISVYFMINNKKNNNNGKSNIYLLCKENIIHRILYSNQMHKQSQNIAYNSFKAS